MDNTNNSGPIVTVFGLIFLAIVAIVVYLLITAGPDTTVNGTASETAQTPATTLSGTVETSASPEPAVTGGFDLSTEQVEALASLGVDPDAVPTSITAEQERCFIQALGDARVAEIKAGAVPSALEFMKAQTCI